MFPYNRKLTTFETKEDRFLERKGWLLPGRDENTSKIKLFTRKGPFHSQKGSENM